MIIKLKKTLDYIFIKKSLLFFALLYTFFSFLKGDEANRVVQLFYFFYMFCYTLYILVFKKELFKDKNLIFGFILLLFAVLTLLFNNSFGLMDIRALIMIFINFIVYLLDDDFTKEDFEFIIGVILILTFCHNFISFVGGLTDYFGLTNLEYYRLESNRFHGMIYCTYTSEMGLLGFATGLYFAIKNISINKIKFIVCLLIAIFSLFVSILSQSRCGIYGLILSLLFFFVVFLYMNKSIDFFKVSFFILIVFLCFFFIYLILYFSGIVKIRKFGFYTSGRLRIWQAYLDVFKKQNMILGMSPSKFYEICRNYLSFGTLSTFEDYFGDANIASKHFEYREYFNQLLPHSEYMREMILFGIIGVIIYIMYIIYLLFNLFKIISTKKFDKYNYIIYFSSFFIIYPLFGSLAENLYSITNSPRFLGLFCFFFMSFYIFKISKRIKLLK